MTRHRIAAAVLGASAACIATTRRFCRARAKAEAGMTTAEYAVGIMAACTFALVLLGVVRSDAVRGALAGLVQSALGLAG